MKKKKLYIIIITIITALLLVFIAILFFTKDNKISKEIATNIALDYANVDDKNVSIVEAKEDKDDGVYEIEFTDNNYKYDIEVDLKTGKVIKFEKDILTNNVTPSENKTISEEEAKKIAADYLKLNIDEIIFTKTKLDYDDGLLIYELEFYKDNTEYEFDINAYTKEIINISVDNNDYTTNNSNNYIGLEKAKEVVKNHTKIDNIFFVESEFDFDNGTPIYELKFYDNNVKYEYEINANSGNIIKYEISNID